MRETLDGGLRLRTTEEDSICTLALAGELDMANGPAFTAELARLEASGAPVKIDLSELEFIDSTGIAILVAAYQRLDRRLQLVPSRARGVRRVISLTGLDTALPFAPSLNGNS
ncbi:MAG TPA: STAS domain-containing protein [Solirubrobacterales bacterium]|nr:STAS domain-containing protein [Solirubrobacterales bacterium]